jgi:hypothetical protein
MAKDIIPVPLVGENITGKGEFFSELFDIRSHDCSLADNRGSKRRMENRSVIADLQYS